MIGRNVPLKRELIEQSSLLNLLMPHHDSVPSRRLNQRISPSATENFFNTIGHKQTYGPGRQMAHYYLARFQTTSTTSPPGGRTVSVSWSPVIATNRFCSVPFQFGNELPSTLIEMLLSASLTE